MNHHFVCSMAEIHDYPQNIHSVVDVEDYRSELVEKLSRAWTIAREKIQEAQKAQKTQYDRRAKYSSLRVGDQVMVYMPSEVQGKDRKLARPFHGPYQVLSVTPTNAEVTLINRPSDPSIFVSLSHVWPCYEEMEDLGGNVRERTVEDLSRTRFLCCLLSLLNRHSSRSRCQSVL